MNQVHPRRVVSLQFLSQPQVTSYLPWLAGPVQFISCKNTIEIPSVPGLQWNLAAVFPFHSTLHSTPLSRAVAAGCVCGEPSWSRLWACQQHSIQGAAAAFYPVIPILLQRLLGWECNFSVPSNFTPSHFSTDLRNLYKNELGSFSLKAGEVFLFCKCMRDVFCCREFH